MGLLFYNDNNICNNNNNKNNNNTNNNSNSNHNNDNNQIAVVIVDGLVVYSASVATDREYGNLAVVVRPMIAQYDRCRSIFFFG